jgi:hypothetical protein
MLSANELEGASNRHGTAYYRQKSGRNDPICPFGCGWMLPKRERSVIPDHVIMVDGQVRELHLLRSHPHA